MNLIKKRIILSFLFIFDILAIIIVILNYNIINRLKESILEFFDEVIISFEINIPKEIKYEFKGIKNFKSIYIYNFGFVILIYFVYTISFIKDINDRIIYS